MMPHDLVQVGVFLNMTEGFCENKGSCWAANSKLNYAAHKAKEWNNVAYVRHKQHHQ